MGWLNVWVRVAGVVALLAVPAATHAEPAPQGSDVAVVCDSQGIGLWTAGQRKIVNEVVADWCLVDPYGKVIWLAQGERLSVLQLDALDAKPLLVVDKLARRDNHESIRVSLVYPHHALGNTHGNDAFFHTITLNDATTDLMEARFGYTIEPTTLERYRKQVRVVQPDMLKRLAARDTQRKPAVTSPCPQRLKVPTEGCDVATDCGLVDAIPNTPYCRVLIGNTCGDGCYNTFVFYDPRAKKYLFGTPPGQAAATSLPFPSDAALFVAPSGKHFIAHGKIFTWQGTVLLDKGASGWLGDTTDLSGTHH